MLIKEALQDLHAKEQFFENVQNLEKALQNDKMLAEKLAKVANLTMSADKVITHLRMSYYDNEILPLKYRIENTEMN